MGNGFTDSTLRFFIGAVRYRNRPYRAFDDMDTVIHATATKIVVTGEYSPTECDGRK